MYGDWNGGWHANQTDTIIENGTVNSFILNLSDGDGEYLWNVWCNDTAGNSAFNATNYTLTVDMTAPTYDTSYFAESNISSYTPTAGAWLWMT